MGRFRRYLAQNYSKEEGITIANGDEQHELLPIITIYILGYDLPEFQTPIVKVKNKIYDAISNEELDVNSEFMNLVTHPCFILQAVPKSGYVSKGTRIERFLHLFSQKLQGDSSNYIIEVDEKEYEAGVKSLEEKYKEEKKQSEDAKKREKAPKN